MFLAHLPSGYIAAKFFEKKFLNNISKKWLYFWVLLGSIAPDLDIFYFYFIDHKQHNHHSYWSHYPILWFPLLIICYFLYQSKKLKHHQNTLLYATLFSFMGCVHLILDSIGGGIWWLAPFKNKAYSIFSTNGQYDIWWFYLIFSKVFIIELLITAFALFLWRKDKRITSANPGNEHKA